MKTYRMFVIATLTGVFILISAPRAHAVDPYSQDLLTNLLYGLVLGDPYGSQGNLPYGSYGHPSYDPYGNPPYDSYGNSTYSPPPYYDPYGIGGSGYGRPTLDPYRPSPGDYNRAQDRRYRYQERSQRLESKYAKAMNRLGRQEAEARAKAYSKYYGDPVRYRKQMEKIDRKYNHKRYKVERNTARNYRKLSRRD